MRKPIAIYSLGVASAAFLLKWLEYQYTVRVFSAEMYIVVIALLFAALGVWAGHRLAAPTVPASFERNAEALEYLGISKREYDVLELLAEGHSNKEIAKKLFVSGNTVKSHLGRVYQKLGVSRRTQAVQKARTLRMIP